jgi:hypothetical protein
MTEVVEAEVGLEVEVDLRQSAAREDLPTHRIRAFNWTHLHLEEIV